MAQPNEGFHYSKGRRRSATVSSAIPAEQSTLLRRLLAVSGSIGPERVVAAQIEALKHSAYLDQFLSAGTMNSPKHFRSLCFDGNLKESLIGKEGDMEMDQSEDRKYGYGALRGQGAQMVEQGTIQSSLDAAAALLEADANHRSLAADQTLMLRMVMPTFAANVKQLTEGMFAWFKHQGFWPKSWIPGSPPPGFSPEYLRMKKAEKIALITSELSECLEAVRNDNPQNEAEELADTLVRLFDYAGGFDIPLAIAFEHKMYRNYQRPMKHGKQF